MCGTDGLAGQPRQQRDQPAGRPVVGGQPPPAAAPAFMTPRRRPPRWRRVHDRSPRADQIFDPYGAPFLAVDHVSFVCQARPHFRPARLTAPGKDHDAADDFDDPATDVGHGGGGGLLDPCRSGGRPAAHRFFCRTRPASTIARHRRVDRCRISAGFYGMEDRLERRIDRYSRCSRCRTSAGLLLREMSAGMKRKVSIAHHRPRPAGTGPRRADRGPRHSGAARGHGFHPPAGARAGKAVILFSTHIMNEAEALCDDIAFIYPRRVLEQGTVAEVKAARQRQHREHLSSN